MPSYADPPPPGPIELSLAGKTWAQRTALKAAALKNVLDGLNYPVSFTMPYGGKNVRIIVTNASVVTVTKGERTQYGLQLSLTARVVGGAALPVDAGGYRFWNVPVKVFNSTYRQVQDADGNTVDMPNFEERPIDAVKQMIADTVTGWAVSQGWMP